MMLELHNVAIRPLVNPVSLIVREGQLACVAGQPGTGKTTLLRAVLGFLPIDSGHISIDGELLTPQSAPYFRRFMAYVPQHLSLPDGYDQVPTDYVQLLKRAVLAGKPLLLVDEPPAPLAEEAAQIAARLLQEAVRHGAAVVAVNSGDTQNIIQL